MPVITTLPVIRDDFTLPADTTYLGTLANVIFSGDDANVVFLNLGTIEAGIFADNCHGLFDNSGSLVAISSPGGDAKGLDTRGTSDVSIVNNGNWTVTAFENSNGSGGWAFGIHYHGLGGTVINNGAMTVTGDDLAWGVFATTPAAVTNSGTMIVTARTGGASGILHQSFSSGVLTNTGEITVTGPLTTYGIAWWGLESPVDAPNVVNSGTITADVAIYSFQPGLASVVDKKEWLLNTGTINGIIDLYRGDDRIDNEGVINGDVYMWTGNDLVDNSLGQINGFVFLEDGNDEFRGGAAAEAVVGGAGDDLLTGGGGDDVLEGNAGSDTINGGDGFDLVSYEFAVAAVNVSLLLQGVAQNTGGDGMDTLSNIEDLAGSAFSDVLMGDGGDNYLFGLDGADTLQGEAGADTLFGGAGVDSLFGGDANDLLIGGADADLLAGGAGTDTADYSGAGSAVSANLAGVGALGDALGDTYVSVEAITGSAFSDVLFGRDFVTDTLTGGDGDDVLMGRYGGDVLNGGAGIDTLSYANSLTGVDVRLFSGLALGGEANGDVYSSIENIIGTATRTDTLAGDDNANFIWGGGGNETITGRDGGDHLFGEAGNDTLLGGAADDVLVGGAGNDTLGGGVGADTADYSASAAGVVINLQAGTGAGGDAAGDALVSIENVIGSAFGDVIIGKANATNNIFDGGAGDDTMSGGLGDDTFVFRAGQGADTITDFSPLAASNNDVVQLVGFGTSFDSFVEIIAVATQVGADTVLDFGGGQTLTLQSVTLGSLTAGDFMFGP